MTLQLIETKTLGTAAASIEFTSIPQDGTDLLIQLSGRSARSNLIDYALLRFNTNASNYSMRTLYWQPPLGASFSDTSVYLPITSNLQNTNGFSSCQFYIPNYAGSTNKSISAEGVGEHNTNTSGEMNMYIIAGLWSNTSAITSIQLTTLTANNFMAGSSASLYKITKGTLAGVVVS
jgi:hypothetical protein